MTPHSAALYVLYGILAAGAGGVVLALPTTRPEGRRLRLAGGVIGLAALAGLAVYWTRWIEPAFQGGTFFVIFALIAVISAVRLIVHPRPVYAALYFILVMLSVTGLCVLAAAEFLAVALVIVYGGAILVTYVFVIMLAQQEEAAPHDSQVREPLAAVTVGFVLVAAITQAMVVTDPVIDHAARTAAASTRGRRPFEERAELAVGIPTEAEEKAATTDATSDDDEIGNTRRIGAELMTTYLVAVEIAGVLLLVAMVGAIAIARKRIEPEALTDDERRRLEQEREDLHRRGREAAPF